MSCKGVFTNVPWLVPSFSVSNRDSVLGKFFKLQDEGKTLTSTVRKTQEGKLETFKADTLDD